MINISHSDNHREWDTIISVLNKLGYHDEAIQIRHILMVKDYYDRQEKEKMKKEIIDEILSQFDISVDTKNALQSVRELKDEISDFTK